MEWYIVRFDDRDRADACIHASMMNRANEPR
jgi:hypothetical protein